MEIYGICFRHLALNTNICGHHNVVSLTSTTTVVNGNSYMVCENSGIKFFG